MWRNWRYPKYCSKHGREKGLEPLRKSCREPGCPLQSQSGRANYCVKHAEEHGIPGPAQCSAACCRRAVKVNGLCRVCADGGIPSELRRCVRSGCPELGTRKRHWLCAAHFQESKQKAIGKPCVFAGCDLNRNVGYRQFCTKHGREHGLLLRRGMCRDDECGLRAILASVGYCAKHARKHGIKIPKYHCSEVDCLRSPLKYGGQCRKHDKHEEHEEHEIHACAA